MGEYNYKKDLPLGELGESTIIKFAEEKGMVPVEWGNKDYRYDFKLAYDNRVYSYELKTDVYPHDTGNIVIEYECRGKASGISVTQADFFVTYFPHFNEIWNIRTSDLKKMIIENPKIPKTQNSGDDGSNTKLYKINKEEFRGYFYKIHEGEEVKKILQSILIIP